jgi:cytoskeletal protein CcmA (bactofilin family)
MFELGKKGPGDKAQEYATRDEFQRETSSGAADFASVPRAPASKNAQREAAVIGPSIHINGDLRGEEDLLIEGEVSGTVQLKNNSLTIGSQGKIRANVYAHSIYVDGFMEGDLYGSDRVTIRKNAQVRGNITSPRVSLEDGAKFKGSIEMDPKAVEAALGVNRAAAKSANGPAATRESQTPAKGDGSFGKPDPAAAVAKRGPAA